MDSSHPNPGEDLRDQQHAAFDRKLRTLRTQRPDVAKAFEVIVERWMDKHGISA